jgi:hypothetical protein
MSIRYEVVGRVSVLGQSARGAHLGDAGNGLAVFGKDDSFSGNVSSSERHWRRKSVMLRSLMLEAYANMYSSDKT